jgi:tRNA A37 methylthiotransferase MiaB
MNDDVPQEVKKRRLSVLNEKVAVKRMEILQGHLNSETEILLDGRVQKGEYLYWKGRTPQFRNVLLPGDKLKAGMILPVKLVRLFNFTYIGEVPARR